MSACFAPVGGSRTAVPCGAERSLVPFSAEEVKKCLPDFLNLALTVAGVARNAGVWREGNTGLLENPAGAENLLQSEDAVGDRIHAGAFRTTNGHEWTRMKVAGGAS